LKSSYRDSGVDIQAGRDAVTNIKSILLIFNMYILVVEQPCILDFLRVF